MTTKLVFLGGGNMAEAIFAGLVSNQQFTIEVIQRNPEKAARLQKTYPRIKVSSTLNYALEPEDLLFLAIKPQQAKEAVQAIKNKINNCVLISVMAGITINSIYQWTNNSKIIRTIPNTPASVAKGVTAIYAPESITRSERELVQQIFSTIGITYDAHDEDEIDKIIPLSSSAIAFVYYFMEGFINAAINQFGFEQKQANKIVKQVLSGSSALLNANSQISIAEQRSRVTSKKGTTEQGLLTFEQEKLHEITAQAMQNCYLRALEMAKEFN